MDSACCSCRVSPCITFQVVAMSFLGVGAPEALLVAVVALVVFGPKGLAEVGDCGDLSSCSIDAACGPLLM